MKRALLIVGILVFATSAIAQTTTVKKGTSYRLTEKSIVKDSAGHILPMNVWQPMMKSGDYVYHPEKPGDTINLIIQKLTPEQKQQRTAAIKAGKPFTMSYAVTGMSFKIDEKTLVKDSAGHIMPYSIWHPMIENGEFILHRNSGADTSFYLTRATAEQKQRRQERLMNQRPPESPFFTTGQPLTPFSVKDIFDNKITPQDWAGKTVVLCFWYSTSPVSQKIIPELNKVVEKYKDNPKVLFIGIALDQPDALTDFNTLTPFNYRLVANGRTYTSLLKINRFPLNVVVDKQGIVRFHAAGYNPATAMWIDRSIAESDAAGGKQQMEKK